MLIRNLKRPGDYARALIANEDQLRIEIANDNRIARTRQNIKKGILQEPTPEQEKDLAERIGDANQRRQKTIDNLRQVFTGEQVDRFLPLLDDDMFSFINIYWRDMKNELTKKSDAKLMDEFYFKNYLDKYTNTIMNQKGLSAPTGTQSSVNEVEELSSLFTWKDEAKKALDRMSKVDSAASKELGTLLKLVPDRRRLESIRALPDADKQRVIENLSKAFSGVETDPNKWNKALRQRDDLAFYQATVPLYRNMSKDQIKIAKDIINPLGSIDTSLFEGDVNKSAFLGPQKPAKPKAKRGPAEAKPVEGEATGQEAEARSLGESDYIPPVMFETSTKGEQDKYITLLSKVLSTPTKIQLFGKQTKNPLKPNSASYYTI